MVRPLPVDYLQPGERPLTVQDRRMISVVDGFLAIAVLWLIVAAGVVFFLVVLGLLAMAPWILIAWSLVAAAAAFLLYRRVATTRYVVTTERVYAAIGRLVFRLDQTTYDKVTDMQVHQSLFGRWFDFGTVTVQTAGHGLRLAGVHRPMRVKQAIEEARSSYLDVLIDRHLEEHPEVVADHLARQTEHRAALPHVVPGAGAEERVRDVETHASTTPSRPAHKGRGSHVVWQGGPSRTWFIATLVGALGGMLVPILFLVVPLFLVQPLFAWLLLGVGAPLLLGIASWSTYLQYRYARYEVSTRGVVVTRGWLSRRRVETSYDKVTDVSTNQGVLARAFGFGTIMVNTAGSNVAPVVFQGIGDPDQVKEIIDRQRFGEEMA